MSTAFRPNTATSINTIASANAQNFGVDSGLFASAMIILNGNISPDQSIPANAVVNIPTMTELTTFMNTGTIPLPNAFQNSLSPGTLAILGVAVLGAYFIITKG